MKTGNKCQCGCKRALTIMTEIMVKGVPFHFAHAEVK